MPASEPPLAGPQRFLGAVFGTIFCAVGVVFLGFLWTAQGFDAPPLLFRVVGSLISFGFIAMGGTLAATAFKGQPPPSGSADVQSSAAAGPGYACPACGARLGEDADVSPKGDVKCGYCRKWFNIHEP